MLDIVPPPFSQLYLFNLLMDKVKSMKKVWVKINSKFRVKNIVSYQRYHIIWLSYPSPFRVSFLLTPLPCLYFDYIYENSRENEKIPRSEINSFRFCSVIRKPRPGSICSEMLLSNGLDMTWYHMLVSQNDLQNGFFQYIWLNRIVSESYRKYIKK